MSKDIEYLAAVENEVRSLKEKIDFANSWYARMTGAFENDPTFDEVLELGRRFRESQGRSDKED